MDADDFFEPDMLEKMYIRAEEDALDITICQYNHFMDCEKQMVQVDFRHMESYLPAQEVFSGTDIRDAGVFQIIKGWAWDKLFRADFVYECGYEFQDLRSSNDGFFVFMLVYSSK